MFFLQKGDSNTHILGGTLPPIRITERDTLVCRCNIWLRTRRTVPIKTMRHDLGRTVEPIVILLLWNISTTLPGGECPVLRVVRIIDIIMVDFYKFNDGLYGVRCSLYRAEYIVYNPESNRVCIKFL